MDERSFDHLDASAKEGVVSTTTRRSRVNILIVDDNPDKLLVLRTVLEELDENVITAASGEEALRYMLHHEFAVILLDVKMPTMDGFETAEMIRRRKRSAHTPIIFVTAYEDEMRTARGYSLGAVDYILTPIIPEVLRTKVKVFVQLFRLREETQLLAEERIALTKEQAARAAAEASIQRSNFLAAASKVLSTSLDVDTTLKGIAEFVVPFLCDLCAFVLVDESRKGLQAAGAVSALSGAKSTLEPLALYELLTGAIGDAVERSLESGEPSFIDLDRTIGADSSAEAADAASPAISLSQVALFPLTARERKLGILLLGLSGSFRFGPTERSLASELAGRTAIALDNAMLYSKTQEADRRKDEFLAMLAHELRSPLAPIRSAVAVMRYVSSENPTLERSREIIERQVTHLARLVDDLLDVARLSQGKVRLEKAPVALATVLERAIETNRPSVEVRKHRLNVSLPYRPVYVEGDAVRLAQVFDNLLNNAVKYTPDGGTIEVCAEQRGEHVVVRIKDNGSGISADLLPNVFDLFVQANRSLARSDGGLGVGLTLVRRMVELHGGSVEARSEGIGKGSEFTVCLPALVQAPVVLNPAPSELEAPTRSKAVRVLLVDDNTDTIEAMATLLELYGHDVRKAVDGPGALHLARDFKPQLVLCDLGLPGMDGFEVVRRLRQQSYEPAPLCVALTGYAQAEDRKRTIEAGFNHHLVKPVDPGVLIAMIEAVGREAEGASSISAQQLSGAMPKSEAGLSSQKIRSSQ